MFFNQEEARYTTKDEMSCLLMNGGEITVHGIIGDSNEYVMDGAFIKNPDHYMVGIEIPAGENPLKGQLLKVSRDALISVVFGEIGKISLKKAKDLRMLIRTIISPVGYCYTQ